MEEKQLANALYASYCAEVRSRGHEVTMDNETLGYILETARWLRDPSDKVGLIYTGLYGNGKTTLMMAVAALVNWLYDSPTSSNRHSFRVVDANDVVEAGVQTDKSAFNGLVNEELLAIDELGNEAAETMVFGRIHTPVKDLLLERYKRQRMTICCTNLVATKEGNQFAQHYGERVVDRFKEMMKMVVFRNPSYRDRV